MSAAFAHPWLLLGLALLPAWAVWRLRRERLRAVPYAPLQHPAQQPGQHPGHAVGAARPAKGTGKKGQRRGGWRRLAAALALPIELLLLAAVVVGMAGPYRASELRRVDEPGIDVALVLDVSLSMMADDIAPTRMDALRDAARRFVLRSGANRVGLVIFARDVFVQSPLTTDRASLAALLEGVTPYAIDQSKSGGTAVGDALLTAAERLAAAKVPDRDQALVLITDGESNLGADPELAARWMREKGIRLYVLGIGGTEPVQVTFEGQRVGTDDQPYLAVLDDTALEAVAAAGDGRYFRAADGAALESIFAELARLEAAPLSERTVEVRRSLAPAAARGAAPLLAALLFLTGWVARRPWR